MLQKNTYKFLQTLQKNNNREWFTENKSWYEQSRADFEKLVSQLIPAMAEFDPNIQYLQPKKCIFRIYRDIRFSQDKTPYKTHFGAVFSPVLNKKNAGYYIHIDPTGNFLTCGHYMLMPEELKKIRKGIYEDFDTFQSIINQENFKKEFGNLCMEENMLKRVPNGFNKNHPAAEYLKLKNFYVMKSFSDKKLFTDNFIDYAASIFKEMQPLNDFLNNLLEE